MEREEERKEKKRKKTIRKRQVNAVYCHFLLSLVLLAEITWCVLNTRMFWVVSVSEPHQWSPKWPFKQPNEWKCPAKDIINSWMREWDWSPPQPLSLLMVFWQFHLCSLADFRSCTCMKMSVCAWLGNFSSSPSASCSSLSLVHLNPHPHITNSHTLHMHLYLSLHTKLHPPSLDIYVLGNINLQYISIHICILLPSSSILFALFFLQVC